MKVDKVRDATTRESAIHYEVTLRVWSAELDSPLFEAELVHRVKKAIEGLN